MTFQTWVLFCATEVVLCFTPGPAVLLVISLALSRGARAGLGGSLGILSANTGYFVLSATSLGAILLASGQLFFLVKWLGAAYLVWFGVRMVIRPSRLGADASSPRDAAPETPIPRRPVGAFWQGLLTQTSNPKALVFFTALLPQFIDTRYKVPAQVGILGVSSVLIEFLVLSIYVIACDRARGWAGNSRFGSGLQRAGGVLLVAAGLRLAAIRQT